VWKKVGKLDFKNRKVQFSILKTSYKNLYFHAFSLSCSSSKCLKNKQINNSKMSQTTIKTTTKTTTKICPYTEIHQRISMANNLERWSFCKELIGTKMKILNLKLQNFHFRTNELLAETPTFKFIRHWYPLVNFGMGTNCCFNGCFGFCSGCCCCSWTHFAFICVFFRHLKLEVPRLKKF